MKPEVNIFWFRRDLRHQDNVGFHMALKGKKPVLPVFIFDTEILEELARTDARVTFIHELLTKLSSRLKEYGSSLAVYHGSPQDVFQHILEKYQVHHVITNRDYEPYALQRDAGIESFLASHDIGFHTYKDQVIFETNEVVKSDGSPYVVYTPYMKAWKARLNAYPIPKTAPVSNYDNLFKSTSLPFPKLSDIGFERSDISVEDYTMNKGLVDAYPDRRDYPSVAGTTKLSPHLRFGSVSIRELIRKLSGASNQKLYNELIWREFFMQILWHFPHTVHKAFRPSYDLIKWRNDPVEFEAWKSGTTGYPLVDAGMRELMHTGMMHNRVRMVVASFLCKHLLIDWRLGEAYFAEKLLDYEQSSNVGNWQWAAGSGVDAAPYFRIFNPTSQWEKFDRDSTYIKKWVPEFGTQKYPQPIVDHAFARERCLHVYKSALG